MVLLKRIVLGFTGVLLFVSVSTEGFARSTIALHPVPWIAPRAFPRPIEQLALRAAMSPLSFEARAGLHYLIRKQSPLLLTSFEVQHAAIFRKETIRALNEIVARFKVKYGEDFELLLYGSGVRGLSISDTDGLRKTIKKFPDLDLSVKNREHLMAVYGDPEFAEALRMVPGAAFEHLPMSIGIPPRSPYIRIRGE